MLTLLLIEDDERLAQLTRTYLERQGATVVHCRDGESGLELALRNHFDAILLDIMLPGLDGIAVCQRIRQHKSVPIIMLTARGEEADRVLGLEIGADDYMAKPFSARELLARIRALVRRVRGELGPRKNTLAIAELTLDPGARRASRLERDLELTAYEFDLLYALASRAGRVLSREQLMDLARGNADEAFDRSVDVHVSRLRKKLDDDPRHPRYIKTVRGIGYLFMSGDP